MFAQDLTETRCTKSWLTSVSSANSCAGLFIFVQSGLRLFNSPQCETSSSCNMSLDDIRRLLDQGDYFEADRLANKNKITDSCHNLDEVNDIADSIDNILDALSSIEDKIRNHEFELRNVKDTAFQMEEEEHAVQLQCKNLSDTCDLIDELTNNLSIPMRVQQILLKPNLNDENSIEDLLAALRQFEKVLRYKPFEPALTQLRCYREQKDHANNIRTKFYESFHSNVTAFANALLEEFPIKFLENNEFTQLQHDRFLMLAPIFDWIIKNNIGNGRLQDLIDQMRKQLIEYVNKCHQKREMYSIFLLVHLSQYLSEQNDSSDFFLFKIYREVLVTVKRNFDNSIDQKLITIRELKAPKTAKCGVLGVVLDFESYIREVELLLKDSRTRRNDIDRHYPVLVTELFRTIDKIEHHRTPTEMIRLENYNYLHDVLRLHKVPCLEERRREAIALYKASLQAYVNRYFGRPLEKVNTFFDGVQAKITQGVKEEEISFQLAFSKQELSKVLQMIKKDKVFKGLEEMYKRIEKHASDPQSNLIQVIWHAMQEEFLSQYKTIQGMIERCYPSSNLGFSFTIQEILECFSIIAQSH